MKRITRSIVVALFAVSAACGSGSGGDDVAQRPAGGGNAEAPSSVASPDSPEPGEGTTAPSALEGPGTADGSAQQPAPGSVTPGTAASNSGQARANPARPTGAAKSDGASEAKKPASDAKGARDDKSQPEGLAPAPGVTPAPGQAGLKSEIVFGSVGTDGGVLGRVMLPVLTTARGWVSDINARGGLNGHPVRLITADDGGDTNRALVLVKQMVEKEKVVGFFGHRMINTLAAVTPYLEEKGVPVLSQCSCIPEEDISPIVFGFGTRATDGTAWSHVSGLVKLTDKRKVALFYCREAPICPALGKKIQDKQKQYGLDIVTSAQVSLVQPDFTAEVIQARNAGAEALVTVGDTPTVIRLAKSAHRQGYFPVISGPQSLTDADFIRNGGKDVEGAVIGSASPDVFNSPLTAEYRELMQKYQPGQPFGSAGTTVWLSGKALEKYAERLPANPTSKDFVDLMYSIRGETLGGLIAPTTFSPKRGERGNSGLCSFPVTVKDGKWAAPSGDHYLCPPGQDPGN